MKTNYEFDELVNAVKQAWDKKIKTIILFPRFHRFALENNYFTFYNKVVWSSHEGPGLVYSSKQLKIP